MVDSQNDMLMWLMNEAKGVEKSVEGWARRLLLVNAVGIHSTSLVSGNIPNSTDYYSRHSRKRACVHFKLLRESNAIILTLPTHLHGASSGRLNDSVLPAFSIDIIREADTVGANYGAKNKG